MGGMFIQGATFIIFVKCPGATLIPGATSIPESRECIVVLHLNVHLGQER